MELELELGMEFGNGIWEWNLGMEFGNETGNGIG
jgi:hypothetical protein